MTSKLILFLVFTFITTYGFSAKAVHGRRGDVDSSVVREGTYRKSGDVGGQITRGVSVNRAIQTLNRCSPTGTNLLNELPARCKPVFNQFVTKPACQGVPFGECVVTAVHEATHCLRGEKQCYLMSSGKIQNVPEGADKNFAPGKIAGVSRVNFSIPADDAYLTTYLKSDSSSRTDFTYLLDELNAYTVDQKVQQELANCPALTDKPKVNPLEHGLPALMTFLSTYAKHAQEKEKATWEKLNKGDTKETIKKLWENAEIVLEEACGKKNSDGGELHYIQALCNKDQNRAISQIIGAETRCPKSCLSGKDSSSKGLGRVVH